MLKTLDFAGPLIFLYSLKVSHNKLKSIKDLDMKAPNLTILDVSNNKIDSEEGLEWLLYLDRIAELTVLGNPFFIEG